MSIRSCLQVCDNQLLGICFKIKSPSLSDSVTKSLIELILTALKRWRQKNWLNICFRSAQQPQSRRLAPLSSPPTSLLPPLWQTSLPPPSPPPTSPWCPPTARGRPPSPPTSWSGGSWWTQEPPSTPRTPCPPPSPPPLPTSPATWRWRRTWWCRPCPPTSSAPSLAASPYSPPPPSTRSLSQRFKGGSLHQNASMPPCLVEFSGGMSLFFLPCFLVLFLISELW